MDLLKKLEEQRLKDDPDRKDAAPLYEIDDDEDGDADEIERGLVKPKKNLPGQDKHANMKKAIEDLKKRTPEEVFAEFDTDGSGLLDSDEFIAMLPNLGVIMSTAKALKYFKMCDTDGSGELDMDEFKTAMFAVDPNTGNSIGFAPTKLLTPKDAFDMFDDDGSQKIDEDEFADVIEYLGIPLSDEKQEAFFKRYDDDGSGFIEYEEFKKIWLNVVNVRDELKKRGVDVPRFATRAVLQYRLSQVVSMEEEKEEQALTEAMAWRKWQVELKEKSAKASNARRRAREELANALDAGGQVYIFGSGTFGQYDSDPVRPSEDFKGFDQVVESWTNRVRPNGPVQLKTTRRNRGSAMSIAEGNESDEDGEGENNDSGDGGGQRNKSAARGSGFSTSLRGNSGDADEEVSGFQNLNCALSTASLWCRQVVRVSLSTNNAFAVTQQGQVLVWGGRDKWWVTYTGDSTAKQKAMEAQEGETTARSALVKGMAVSRGMWTPEPEEPLHKAHDKHENLEQLKYVTKYYYKVWEPPPSNNTRAIHMNNVILPRLTRENVALTLKIRGVDDKDKNKLQLLSVVYEILEVEARELGFETMQSIRETEFDVRELITKKKIRQANILTQSIIDTWRPLLGLWAENKKARAVAERGAIAASERAQNEVYEQWRKNVDTAYNTALVVKDPNVGLSIEAASVTARGAGPAFAPKDAAVRAISTGAFHAAVIHRTGTLYTWGDSNFGRLGLRGENGPAPTVDASIVTSGSHVAITGGDRDAPTLVTALQHIKIRQVACGFSHSIALSDKGLMFVWGGGMTGKLGLGPIADKFECYCPCPTVLHMPGRTQVKFVSCGSSHSGAVTVQGDLYVWGCGDSGRLGLGPKLRTCYEPTLVKSLQLAGVHVESVACGVSHTVVATAVMVSEEGDGNTKVQKVYGGHVYVAGPAAVLGKYTPHLRLVRELHGNAVKQVSAGNGMTACVTRDGELYTWGMNEAGALGHDIYTEFIRRPTLVRCLYTAPRNLAEGKKAKQSSLYNGHGPDIAVNGDIGGMGEGRCIHTQVDEQPFWEVDLGELCVIEQIALWNREDSPPDKALASDLFTQRLFPCWVMVSTIPFKRELLNAWEVASAKRRITKRNRRSVWHLPTNVVGRYVRIQLEGTNYMHFAELQVFGVAGVHKSVGKVDSVDCGNEAMITVVKPLRKPEDIVQAYINSSRADPGSTLLLRQYTMFFKAWDEHKMGSNNTKCPLDRGSITCEVCDFVRDCVQQIGEVEPGPNGRLRRLESVVQLVLAASPPPVSHEKRIIDRQSKGIVGTAVDTWDQMKKVWHTFGTKGAAKRFKKKELMRRVGISHEAPTGTEEGAAQPTAEEDGEAATPTPALEGEPEAAVDNPGKLEVLPEGKKVEVEAEIPTTPEQVEQTTTATPEAEVLTTDAQDKMISKDFAKHCKLYEAATGREGDMCKSCKGCILSGGFRMHLALPTMCGNCRHPIADHCIPPKQSVVKSGRSYKSPKTSFMRRKSSFLVNSFKSRKSAKVVSGKGEEEHKK